MPVTSGKIVGLNGLNYEGYISEPIYETQNALHFGYDKGLGSADRLLLWGIYIHFLGP